MGHRLVEQQAAVSVSGEQVRGGDELDVSGVGEASLAEDLPGVRRELQQGVVGECEEEGRVVKTPGDALARPAPL